MIYIDKKKLTVDGVDVYPDHESPTQFWYIPGTIQLAHKGGRKALSYLWYTDSDSDTDGTGFLNFEVNTALSADTLGHIRRAIASAWNIDQRKITLSSVPYQAGNVNFSVLGPVAAQAGDQSKDTAVVYRSKEQLVWNAGSSSLVGDNAAVCSVKFTREGKLAAAMKSALQSKNRHIAALYRLEFLAMRPSVTFTVKGEFKKTIEDFKFSIGLQLPLEALVLDLGINAQWQKIMQHTDLKIEVINYTGEGDAQLEGLKWAKQLLLDYVLKNFFEVQLGADPTAWSPLAQAPQAEEAVMKAKQVEEAAAEQVADEKAQTDDKGSGQDTPAEDLAKAAETVKEIVKAAGIPIPKVNIRAAYYSGKQVNSIDFIYSEKKATLTTVLPQALIGLDLTDQPNDYITQINRTQDPFGLRYAVTVSLPSSDSQAKVSLQTLNLQARYPAGKPRGQQTTVNLTVNDGISSGLNPLPFQYDANGSAGVEYVADFVFKPDSAWQSDTFQYKLSGISENGLIVSMPESVAEFLSINVALGSDFIWDNCDSALVILSSKKWKGDKRIVIQQGKEAPQVLQIRAEAQYRDEAVHYKVELRKNNKVVHAYGPHPVTDKQVTVVDRFLSHIPIYFSAGFSDDVADITVHYQDGDEEWEDQFQLEPGQKKVQRIVPVLKELKLKSLLQAEYVVNYGSGGELKGTIKGGQTVMIKSPLLKAAT